jgi:hypothetical protein
MISHSARPGVLRRLMRRWPAVLASTGLAVIGTLASGGLTQAHAADTLISTDRPVTASSIENSGTPANAVTDGVASTRWSSAWSDPQWIAIDLGGSATISKVVLQWEAAYGKAFQVQDSADGTNWTSLYSTTTGTGGTQSLTVSGTGRYVRMYGTARGTGYGYSLFELQVYGTLVNPVNPAGYINANPQVTGVTPSQANPPNAYFHEFQANCAYTHTLPDDPIVFPNQPGASHMHTFLGSTVTTATTTTAAQLDAGGTSCLAPGDKSGYWMPTMYNNGVEIDPLGPQVIYYKTGVIDYTSVRPFPKGLRFVVGNAKNTDADKFLAATVEGFECGDSYKNKNIPATCPTDRSVKLNIRYQAPSCWDGIHLDSPDHQSHMAYPIDTGTAAGKVCPADHPVAVPMLEFKMAWPVNGDMSKVHYASGAGPTFHYDFFNGWDAKTPAAMVNGCIVAARQCDAQGHDGRADQQPAPYVLNSDYVLP